MTTATDLVLQQPQALALAGDTPADWEAMLADRTQRTATSLRMADDATLDECSAVLGALWQQVKSCPWHIGDALLETQRLYPDTYQQLLDPETTPQGQTAANIRSMCRAVPSDLRDPRLTFWQYTPLVPLLRSDKEAERSAGVALIDIAARGGWTRDQISQAVRDVRRGLEQKHRGRVEKRIAALADQSQPVPPTVSRQALRSGPAAFLPGSRELERIVDAALVLPREQAGEVEAATTLRMILKDEDIARVVRAVTLWLQTDCPDEYLTRVLSAREARAATPGSTDEGEG